MDAWSIYWVMQLDSIKEFFTAVGTIALLTGIVASVISVVGSDEDWAPNLRKWASRTLIGSLLVCLIGVALLPSSKTAAAMLILPAIANNEAVQEEAKELYSLAKEALKEVVINNEEEKK